jgi:hypothetical protein
MDDESADEGREEPTAAGDTSPSRADVDLVVAACRDQLRPLDSWTTPGSYPQSLGMAMLDAIWATGARYSITRGVLARYVSSSALLQAVSASVNVHSTTRSGSSKAGPLAPMTPSRALTSSGRSRTSSSDRRSLASGRPA